MGYLEESLVPGEQVIMKAKFHWAMFLYPMIVLVISWYVVLTMLSMSMAKPLEAHDIPPLFYLIFFLIGLILIGRIVALMASTELAVTSTRIIAKTGVLKHGSFEIMVPKVKGTASIHGV